jgi:hypothetical protein
MEVRFNIMGISPMIMHRFSQKAWRELFFPSVRENRAGLEQKLKHDPMAEYRGALYVNRDSKAPTLFHIPNGSVHSAMCSAALDMAGPAKAQMERLTQVIDINIHLYGVPQIFCAMVRNTDIRKTPDVRTRPIFPQWGAQVTISYMKTALTERSVAHLMSAAGQLRGIGDWRPEKGGPYGRFHCVDDKNKEWQSLLKLQGRKAQQVAFDHPAYFDDDTRELLEWFPQAVRQREMEEQLTPWEIEPRGGRRSIVESANGDYVEAD